MRVHADLHEGLGDRARAVGNAGIFQKAGKVRFRGGTEPGGLLIVKAAVSLDERVERGRWTRLMFVHERHPEDGEQPEAIGEQDVVKQFHTLGSAAAVSFSRMAFRSEAFAWPL